MPGWRACLRLRALPPSTGGREMQQSRSLPQLYSVAEIAKRFGVSSKTITRRIDEGKIRRHKIGKQIRISEEDALNYLAQGRW